FDNYYAETPAESVVPATPTSVEDSTLPGCYGSSFLLDAVKSAQRDKQVVVNPRDELNRYCCTTQDDPEYCIGGAQHCVAWLGIIWPYRVLRLPPSTHSQVAALRVRNFGTDWA
ncbi:hypothetical protein C8F04DRAFT_1056592, partial [Mycena alexandri]